MCSLEPIQVSTFKLSMVLQTFYDIGGFKCVVEKDGKTSEGVFDVTIPIVHEDLIEPVEETVNFVSGQDLRLEVTKLGGVITDLVWECDGVPVVNGEGGFKIVNKSR